MTSVLETDLPSRVEALYLHTPTPEFRLALDLAAGVLNERHSLAILSSPFYAVELARRVGSPLHIAGSRDFNPHVWLPALQPWAWGELHPVSLETQGSYQAVLWAEPEQYSAAQLAAALHRNAVPGCRLAVVASTRLRRFLPPSGADSQPARQPLGAAQLPGLLQRCGWIIESRLGFHGLRSMLWTSLMRLAESIDRPDWADRCRFGLRAAYQENGSLWLISPLTLITTSRA